MAATHRPGRLARTLGLTGSGPYFGLYSEAGIGLYDDSIQSVAIHRGKSGRGGGVTPSTLEVTVKGGPVLHVAGHNVRLFLRDAPAANLAARLGTTGPAISARFTGRLAKTGVDDTGRRLATTYTAASWITRLAYSGVHTTPTAGQSVKRVITDLFKLNRPWGLAGVSATFHGDFDTVAETTDPVTYSEAIARYTTDLGILVRETRAGISQVMPLPYRITSAATRLATALPLTRSQAISPARWEQPNERPPVTVEYDVRNTNNNVVRRSVDIAAGTEPPETVVYDWSYIRADTDHLYHHAYGIVYESSPRQFAVPSVKIDLLHLIGSSKQYHRDQAGQLLGLEPGDPVYFSGDWPSVLQGVHFAEGITETIDADTWTLELSLVPYAHAMGAAPSPAVPARVWDSAGNTWNNETRKWNEA